MKPLARYHLAWALALAVITGIVFGYALVHWLRSGRPPVYTFWAAQMLVVCGAYRCWYHVKAFSRARKS